MVEAPESAPMGEAQPRAQLQEEPHRPANQYFGTFTRKLQQATSATREPTTLLAPGATSLAPLAVHHAAFPCKESTMMPSAEGPAAHGLLLKAAGSVHMKNAAYVAQHVPLWLPVAECLLLVVLQHVIFPAAAQTACPLGT